MTRRGKDNRLTRHGMARRSSARHGIAWLGTKIDLPGMEWLDGTGIGKEQQASVARPRAARPCMAWRSVARHGTNRPPRAGHGDAWRGRTGRGLAMHGTARNNELPRQGMTMRGDAMRGIARQDASWLGMAGTNKLPRCGAAGIGDAGRCQARSPTAGGGRSRNNKLSWLGMTALGGARPGNARFGNARQGAVQQAS